MKHFKDLLLCTQRLHCKHGENFLVHQGITYSSHSFRGLLVGDLATDCLLLLELSVEML